jgi:hypothetical protein
VLSAGCDFPTESIEVGGDETSLLKRADLKSYELRVKRCEFEGKFGL